MELSLENLSANELILYNDAISLGGEIGVISKQLADLGTFDKYREIHKQYLKLYTKSSNCNIKIEALKRLIFLN